MKWDKRMLDMAALVASWSKDESTNVGAVIVDDKNRIVSVGYNGFPRGVKDESLSRDEKLRRTIHAERNAILFAKQDVSGCTIYVTHMPCAQCAALLIQAGITRVVTHAPRADFASRWAEDIESALAMFEQAGMIATEMEA